MQDCLFCRIAAGQIPADIVYEDEFAVAFRDIDPKAPTHVLVIPRVHVANIIEAAAKPGLMDRLSAVVAAVAKSEGIDREGFRVVANTGIQAGQTVEHLHLHLLGGRSMGWPPG